MPADGERPDGRPLPNMSIRLSHRAEVGEPLSRSRSARRSGTTSRFAGLITIEAAPPLAEPRRVEWSDDDATLDQTLLRLTGSASLAAAATTPCPRLQRHRRELTLSLLPRPQIQARRLDGRVAADLANLAIELKVALARARREIATSLRLVR